MVAEKKPWSKTPESSKKEPVKIAMQRVSRWSKKVACATDDGNVEAEGYAFGMLEQAVADAYTRMGVHDPFGDTPNTASKVDEWDEETIAGFSDEEIAELRNRLWNDPLADAILEKEQSKRAMAPDQTGNHD